MKLSKNSIEYLLWIFEMKQYKECGWYSKISYPHNIKGRKYISLGTYTKIGKNSWIEAIDSYEGIEYTPNIYFGNNIRIVGRCHIAAINEIIIEDNVLIASDVFITDHAHGKSDEDDLKLPPAKRKLYSKGTIKIGKNVWIGEKVTILSGVEIGENSIIGANSVVTHNIPANCVAAGVPARIIKWMK